MNPQLKQPPLRVLTNGCSHTRACIPDLTAEEHNKSSWPRVLEAMDNYDVINLAQDGKANHYIIEETIRYLFNNAEVPPHIVVIQLTDFERINVFNRRNSGQWIPGVFATQQGKNMTTDPSFIKIPGLDVSDLHVNRTTAKGVTRHGIGDSTYKYEQITTLSMLAALSIVCSNWNIRLGILPYFGLNNSIEDATFQTIPKENWIVANPQYGLYNDLLYYYETPDTWHFEAAAHKEIAQIVNDWITEETQIVVNESPFDNAMKHHMFVYD